MKTGFLDRLIDRLDKVDPKSLQVHFLRLAQEQGLMETIFRSIQEGIAVLNSDGRVTYANRAAEEMLGVAPQPGLAGTFISKYLRDIDWHRILDFDTGEWSKIISHEIEVSYPARKFLSFYVVPLPAVGGAEKGILLMLRDTTKDREQEASMLESERLNAVKVLAATVAHEIGNPLNALSIHLQLIDRELGRLDPKATDAIRELLAVAKTEVSRLDLIITQFLRALRPGKPNLASSQIEEVLKDTLAVLQQEFENRKIRVEVDGPSGLPSILVDAHQMKQAFFNVIKNALEAMRDGGLLRISLSCSDRYVGVSFKDTGTGIPQQDISRIFEPYYTTKSEGTGLGLMVVQRIVHDHGGAIEVHTEQDVGTTVRIFLPLAERQMRLLRSKSATGEESS